MTVETPSRAELLAQVASLERAVDEGRLRSEAAASDEASFRELVESANTIVLRWDLQGRVTYLNDFGLQLFGFEREELVGRSVIGSIVPETDTIGRDLKEMIRELLARPDEYVHNENENMCRDGTRLWITWRNRALRDSHGEVRELLSFGMDTTERKRAEEALRNSESRYRVLFQSIPIALVERDISALKEYVDRLRDQGVDDFETYLRERTEELPKLLSLVRVSDVNAAAMELFEISDASELDSFAYVDDRARFAELVRSLICLVASGCVASREVEGTIHSLRGQRRHVLVRTTVVPGADETPSRVVTALVDVTERKEAMEALRASEERFRFLAVHDNLTGLFNTRYLYEQLPREIAPERAPCSVVFMDLDRFKHVVDTYGHLNGSRAVQEVAETVQGCIAEPAFAVAYAGDEFVVVLPGASKRAAQATAAELRSRVGARVFLADAGYAVRLSASLGIATYPDDAADMKGLLAAADAALFDAKAQGRNTVAAAGAEKPGTGTP
jgi:diguanylate cyclase (GGDEF)-like protein/PAS domain S-box-containing protein